MRLTGIDCCGLGADIIVKGLARRSEADAERRSDAGLQLS